MNENGFRWHVCQTQPRREWIARMNLADQGFEVFLPTIETNRSVGRRMAQLVEPLFPGYLFVGWDIDARGPRSVTGTRGVLRLLTHGVDRKPQQVPTGVVERLLSQANRDGLIEQDDAEDTIRFAAGDWLSVNDGAFAGYHGKAANQIMASDQRVAVLLHCLGRDIVVQLASAQVSAAF